MNSFHSMKGFEKPEENLNDHVYRRSTRKRLIIVAVSFVVLVTTVCSITITLVRNRSSDNSPEISSSSPPTATIRTVCDVTPFPDSCFSSISNLHSPSTPIDPQRVLNLSMEVAASELTKLRSLPNALASRSRDSRVRDVLADCSTVIDDAIDAVNNSISAMMTSVGEDDAFSNLGIDDVRTWLSSAITNQETCVDGLRELNSSLVGAVELAMKNATMSTSNSLAIASRIFDILKDLGFSPHGRKLLWSSAIPEWVETAERRLLQSADPTPNSTVSISGKADFRTIQEAVDAAPKNDRSRFVIYVKAGVYRENVTIGRKHWNLMMYGDGMNSTIVTASLNFVDGTPTFRTATFAVTGKGFIAKKMGFKNEAGPEKHQAVAFRSGSDLSIFEECMFDAYQDTLYAHSNRQFYRNCYITGTIDFIFGNSAMVMQDCNVVAKKPLPNQFNTVTAQGKKIVDQNTGIVMQRCNISVDNNITADITYLGRPWKLYSTTVVMQSFLGRGVNPKGWMEWIPLQPPPATIRYRENANTGPGSNVSLRVNWTGYASSMTPTEASSFTVKAFLHGGKWISSAGVTVNFGL